MMTHRIGFVAITEDKKPATTAPAAPRKTASPRQSVVQVFFEDRHCTLAYYNDQFDLHTGDLVYVEGKLAGLRGRVTEVNYNFKIKKSDYKRVIAVADTEVYGQFHMAGSHFITFDRGTLPPQQAVTWFKAPATEEDEFVSGYDDTVFHVDDIKGMQVRPQVLDRGHEYYLENRVRYLCIDGTKGYAVVEGNTGYEVEFTYNNGEISGLTCTCFCSGTCKHEVAVVLQLRDLLEHIEKRYADWYHRSGYFAAVCKHTLFAYAIEDKEEGSFIL